MTIGKKLMFSCSALATLVVSMGLFSLVLMRQVGHELTESNTHGAKRLQLLGEIQGFSGKLRGAVRGVLFYSRTPRHDLAERSAREFKQFSDKVNEASKELELLESGEAEREAARTQRAAVTDWLPIAAEIERLCSSGDHDAALTIAAVKSVPQADKLDRMTDLLDQAELKSQQRTKERGEAIQRRAIWATLTCILAGLTVLGFVVAMILQVTKELRGMSSELSSGAAQIYAASDSVASSSQSLAQSATEQAASLQRTSDSAAGITGSALSNARAAEKATGFIGQAESLGKEVGQAVQAMHQSIDEIGKSTSEVSRITKTIEEIAFQTNILALNAAVEAARAGEAGAGFAVVADEVRALAQRSSAASKSTSELIAQCVASAEVGKGRLEALTTSFERSTAIQSSIKQTAEGIAGSSRQQALAVTEIGEAINQMTTVTHSTAAHSEESAAASEELSAQAATFDAIVTRLRQMVG
jgi:methyl-accepting chemotaxis protein